MKYIKFLLVGIFFGIIMAKSEVISWYRIFEMFNFDSFHMYGIIGSAIVVGAISLFLIKKFAVKNIKGETITIKDKDFSITRYLVGGSIFGLGWALAGACPGPMFVLLTYNLASMLVVIGGAILGTYLYGSIRTKLPH